MAIDPLQIDPPRALLQPHCGKKRSGPGSGFEELLNSRVGGEGGAAHTPQDAARLLRIEMMLRSLALAGDAETVEATSSDTLRLLLAGMQAGPGSATQRERAFAVDGALEPAEEQRCADQAGVAGIEATAAGYLGTPYRFGGEGRDGIDCSSFVQRVYLEHRVELPRTAREQIQVGREVAQEELRKGDLVFFQTYASYPSHVGIYLGDGKMIHASSERGEVTISDMNSEYYRSRYLGAKRVA